MALKVNLRHLGRNDLHLAGELPASELDLDVHDEMVRALEPLHYDLEVQLLDRNLLVQGSLKLALSCECVRCLKAFKHKLILRDWACHLALEGEEAVAIVDDSVDLTPAIREDILLAFPAHPVCDQGCRGLTEKPSRSKKAKNPGGLEVNPSAWAELDKLKFRS